MKYLKYKQKYIKLKGGNLIEDIKTIILNNVILNNQPVLKEWTISSKIISFTIIDNIQNVIYLLIINLDGNTFSIDISTSNDKKVYKLSRNDVITIINFIIEYLNKFTSNDTINNIKHNITQYYNFNISVNTNGESSHDKCFFKFCRH